MSLNAQVVRPLSHPRGQTTLFEVEEHFILPGNNSTEIFRVKPRSLVVAFEVTLFSFGSLGSNTTSFKPYCFIFHSIKIYSNTSSLTLLLTDFSNLSTEIRVGFDSALW